MSLNKQKIKLKKQLIKAYHDKSLTQQAIKESLKFLSENIGCKEDMKTTEEVLDSWVKIGIIDTKDYQKCIESSACNRWL